MVADAGHYPQSKQPDAFSRAVAVKAGLYGTSTIHEQFDSSRGGQSPYRYEDLAGNAERLAAGGHQPKTGHLPDQGVGEGRGRVDHVLIVVEDNNKRAPGEVSSDELCRRSRRLGVAQSGPQGSECSGRGRGDPLGICDASELD